MCKSCVNKCLIELIKANGVTNTARVSGVHITTLNKWIYEGSCATLNNAMRVLSGLGYELTLNSFEEMKASIKKFGVKASAKASGIALRTIRSYLYAGINPTLDKVEQIMQAIGKPLKIVKAINKV